MAAVRGRARGHRTRLPRLPRPRTPSLGGQDAPAPPLPRPAARSQGLLPLPSGSTVGVLEESAAEFGEDVCGGGEKEGREGASGAGAGEGRSVLSSFPLRPRGRHPAAARSRSPGAAGPCGGLGAGGAFSAARPGSGEAAGPQQRGSRSAGEAASGGGAAGAGGPGGARDPAASPLLVSQN